MIKQEKRSAAMGAWAMGSCHRPSCCRLPDPSEGWRWTFGFWPSLRVLIDWYFTLTRLGAWIDNFISVGWCHHNTYLHIYERVLSSHNSETEDKATYEQDWEHKSQVCPRHWPDIKEPFFFSIVRPTKMSFLSPIVFLLSSRTLILSHVHTLFNGRQRYLPSNYISFR